MLLLWGWFWSFLFIFRTCCWVALLQKTLHSPHFIIFFFLALSHVTLHVSTLLIKGQFLLFFKKNLNVFRLIFLWNILEKRGFLTAGGEGNVGWVMSELWALFQFRAQSNHGGGGALDHGDELFSNLSVFLCFFIYEFVNPSTWSPFWGLHLYNQQSQYFVFFLYDSCNFGWDLFRFLLPIIHSHFVLKHY